MEGSRVDATFPPRGEYAVTEAWRHSADGAIGGGVSGGRRDGSLQYDYEALLGKTMRKSPDGCATVPCRSGDCSCGRSEAHEPPAGFMGWGNRTVHVAKQRRKGAVSGGCASMMTPLSVVSLYLMTGMTPSRSSGRTAHG